MPCNCVLSQTLKDKGSFAGGSLVGSSRRKTVVRDTRSAKEVNMILRAQHLLRHCLYFTIFLMCWQPTILAANEPEYFNVIEKLHVKLLQHYNKQIRPVINHTQILNIDASMKLTSFDFDEAESRFSARGFFFTSWNDPRFTWSPAEYDGLETIHVPSEKIWTPDLEVFNSPGVISSDRSFAPAETLITSNGTIYFVPISNLISTCLPNPTLYPFDSVTCTTVVGSWTHSALKMRVNPKDNETKVNVDDLVSSRSSHWTLVDTKVDVIVKIYECCPEPYQTLKLTFVLKRSFSTSPAIITPTVAIVVLTLATLFIPPGVSAKIFVGMINLAILCGYSLYFHLTLPSGDHQTPLIVSLYSGSLILAVISIVLSVFSLRCIRLPKSSSPPNFIQSCLSNRIGCILGVSQQDNRNRSLTNDGLAEKKAQQIFEVNESRETVKQQWLNLCLALDRLMLIIFSAVFALIFICYLG